MLAAARQQRALLMRRVPSVQSRGHIDRSAAARTTGLAVVRPAGRRRRRPGTISALAVAALLSVVLSGPGAGAAERTTPARIGVLSLSAELPPTAAGLRAGLQSLGYREDQQFVLDVRFARGDTGALSSAARALVQDGVDLIFAAEGPPAVAARQATTDIPIVFAGVGEPLGLGLVDTFARPGGNVTGVADRDVEMAPKRLDLFRATVRGLKRVFYVYDASDSYAAKLTRAYRAAARQLGLELVERDARTEQEALEALAQIKGGAGHGILSPPSAQLNLLAQILDAAAQRRIPTMGEDGMWVDLGGLASYGPDTFETGRQAARLVDRILKGARPAELPVEVNSKVEFVVSLGAARSLRLIVPPDALYRVDRLAR
jgi:putative ABC transport system substrate-binding protein